MPQTAAPTPILHRLAAGGTKGHLFPAEALARELMARGHDVVIHTERRGAVRAGVASIPHVALPASSLGGHRGEGKGGVHHPARRVGPRADLKRRKVAVMVAWRLSASRPRWPRSRSAAAAAARTGDAIEQGQPVAASPTGWRRRSRKSRVRTVRCGRIVETGNPVRQSILDARGDYPPFGDGLPLRLLVVGGSQWRGGVRRVALPALPVLPEHIRRRLRVSLQYKGEDADAIAMQLRDAGIDATVRPFFDDMASACAMRTRVTRAGATTAADLLVIGRPVFVPLPHGAREEQKRAETLAQAGVGWHPPEAEPTPEALMHCCVAFESPTTLPPPRARRRPAPGAASRLADAVERLLPGRG